MTIKPVAWICIGSGDGWSENKIVRSDETASFYASLPQKWNVTPLCRHDEVMAEIERLQAENAKLTVACAAYEVEAAGLREQLAGSDENTLLRHLAYIRQKSGVGMKPMLSELADAIAERIAEARNKALDEAAASVEAVAHEGLHASMWRNKFERVAETIRLMKGG